jgi:hypothetical protein
VEHSIFAMEVCARLEPGSVLRSRLHEAARGYGPRMNLQQKWEQYRRAREILFQHLYLVERGCWDYFDDDARALRDYDMWSKGMTTEEGARKAPSGASASAGAGPYRSQTHYLTFTMAFLIVHGSPTDRAMAALCNIPEANLWRRDVFAHLLHGLGSLNFASVKSDVVYLIPRDEGWALTAQDLEDPKFHYLRQLV